ncbi:MAG: sensor histidine kinase [Burkholderiaceae bacterium]|nr:sensor histidine kinase [Burkholderiaceae bacterium]
MNTSALLISAWKHQWRMTRHRPEPLWARLAVITALGLVVGLTLALLSAAVNDSFMTARWWRVSLPANVLLSLSVTYTFTVFYRALELGLPAQWVAAIGAWRDWRAALFYSALSMASASVGFVLGLRLIDHIWQLDILRHFMSSRSSWLQFVFISVFLSLIQWLWWRMRGKQQALQLKATEAQLKLLQAQIEPHFLFNTLANVQSLIDYDTPRAKKMLESFTDYLRASLQNLRRDDCTLEQELETVASYLVLLQTRMDERLRYAIEASAEARAATVPPLLLQPLVENAIHHGLEPKIEGGMVRITATVAQGRLHITVADDGMGLDAPPRPGRRGSGLALNNIRERLQTRYDGLASLRLIPGRPGTEAVLELPYQLK